MNFHRSLFLFLLTSLLMISTADATWTWNWTRKVGFAGLNDPFCVNPLNQNTIFCSAGNSVIVVSRNRGKTWSAHSIVSGGNQIKSIAVNARDTSVILVAQEADPADRIMRTTNNGSTWTQTLSGGFYYFGNPLAYEPALDDENVYTMISTVIYRSTDFGLTWDSVSSSAAFGSFNGGWEDAFIRPDSSNILFVADNATGIWKSYNHGSTWKRVHVAGGEIPAMAVNKQNPAIAYATRWGGGGGFIKTTNYGETWVAIPQFTGLQTWGVGVSTENPEFVAFGTWGPSPGSTGGVYISRDAGGSWERTYSGFNSFNNHAVCVLDTLSVFSLWGDGIWKLKFPGRVNGTVFYDENVNGMRDSGEATMANWKVHLEGGIEDSVLTDPFGAYAFAPLAADTYSVRIDTPVTWNVTSPGGGTHTGFIVADGEAYYGKDFGVTAPVAYTSQVVGGWNMLSLPLTVPDRSRVTVFPSSSSSAFSFNSSGYHPAELFQYGVGYWLKFPTAQEVLVAGGERLIDTVHVVAGWNMIGSISASVAVDSIEQIPSGIVLSSFFTFENGLYSTSPVIEPLRAYWVKSSAPGKLILKTKSQSISRPRYR
ncbi:MAG: SdrD B-like domain-containing protein [Bacteroidota bacterium]